MSKIAAVALLLPFAALLGGAIFTVVGVHRTETAAPPAGRFIEVDGRKLHYIDRGEGTPVVLLHGANSSLLEMQTSLVPLLARHHRVLAFDRPGFGYSERGKGPWPSPARLADLILDACDALGAHRPVVVGHSWAGSVVMSALLHEPQRVAGGVLLAGVAGHWVPSPGLLETLRHWPRLNALFAYTLAYPAGRIVLPAALQEVFAPHPVPQGHAARIGAELALRPATYLGNAQDMRELASYLQRESSRYPEIDSPLLVIHGTDDELVPFWNHGKRLQAVVEGVETALFPGHGHALHHVDPDGVAQRVVQFAARVSAGPGPSE